MMSKIVDKRAAIHWFRKGLRLHDNPALLEACRRCKECIYPVFILDPHFAQPDVVGVNRYAFLLDSLRDLDSSLRKLGTRLYVVQGQPEPQLLRLVDEWRVDLVTYEVCTEPYAQQRDSAIGKLLRAKGVDISTHATHTLHDLERYVYKCRGSPPSSHRQFFKLFASLPEPRTPTPPPTKEGMPMLQASAVGLDNDEFDVPTLQDVGYPSSPRPSTKFPGGETEALDRLRRKVSMRPQWTARFEKPKTSPNTLEPSTTVLSPYLKFGCLSPATFYHELSRVYAKSSQHTKPPVSLHGQLLWREFFWFQSYVVPNFDRMEGNPKCRQIPWERNPGIVAAWKDGRTGYPFIDAIMMQLRTEGWIHHLARHAVACFLTRGDLWQHWEEGQKVFDRYLLDADWALNAANWQWLSCSNFFYQYFRCYSPIAFGRKTDSRGEYIRKYLPALRNMPAKYIYEPWKAPLGVQRGAGCVVGEDYPERIVIHDDAKKANMAKMKAAYAAAKLQQAQAAKAAPKKRARR